MFIIKYSLINISKNTKLYIPLFIIISLFIFAMLCVFSIRKNVESALEGQFEKDSVAAITPQNGTEYIPITIDLIESYVLTEYVYDYYAFTENWAGSKTLSCVPSPSEGIWNHRPEKGMDFTLIAYSDVSKSTHFKFGNRRMIDGHFALSTSECNVSTELAETNGLSVGDYIEIFIFYYSPQYYNLEIVGIYEDNTKEITNELPMIAGRATESFVLNGTRTVTMVQASKDNISGNQILTANPSAKELKTLSSYDVAGYDVAAYYAHDEKSVLAYTEVLNRTLPNSLVVLDSAELARYISNVLNKTISSFIWFMAIVCIIVVIFCTLIVFNILKDRTYDISVFRARGMSRVKTAILLSSENFIVSIFAFAVAELLYFVTFVPIAEFVHYMQDIFTSNDSSFYSRFSIGIQNAARAYKFTASVSTDELIYGFVAFIILTGIVSFVTSLYISRNEPMKTMAEV